MTRGATATIVLALLATGTIRAQTPTGAIDGFVTDSSGAALPGAHISITNRQTKEIRTVDAGVDGHYAALTLLPGLYGIAAQANGFKRLEREAVVEAGTSTPVNLVFEIGELSEVVTVSAAAPTLHDTPQVAGVVGRDQIENLPLNGRNFLDLAKLEPGVTSPTRGTNNRIFVPLLGAGLSSNPRIGSTLATVDGANINAAGTIGTTMQVSQEVVQEFQIATVNFDPTTGLTTNGAINIVTRSGGNEYRESGFFYDRDHHFAAYPGLRRDPRNPDPFFERRQFGTSGGGRLVRDRAFFFASYERNDQQSVMSVQPPDPEFAALGGVFPNPYLGNQFSARVDARLRPGQNVFIRHTYDGNSTFGPSGPQSQYPLPSGWSRTTNAVHQSVAGLTSVLSPTLVNDLRVSYLFIDSPEQPATTADCPTCLGVGAPPITIANTGITFGMNRLLTSAARRYQVTDHLVWQHGRHQIGFGGDWEHTLNEASSITQDPAQITLWSPAMTRQRDPMIPLPTSFTTLEDILRLPLQMFQTAVGPGEIPYAGFAKQRVLDLSRIYASDTWRLGPRLSVQGGLAWSYEPNALNYDLTKPQLLAPLLGATRLNPPSVQLREFSPTAGAAWTATRDGRTVVRGGMGRYFDPLGSTNSADLGNERLALFPLGVGRIMESGQNIPWHGAALDFRNGPTSFTGAELLSILPILRAELLRSVNPGNHDFSVRNIDQTKEGMNLFDPSFVAPSALHFSLGVQREVASGLVVSGDLVWKEFRNVIIAGIDYNRFNSRQGAVLGRCLANEAHDIGAVCSNGPITFDNSEGHARYRGLLVRVEKRFAGTSQFVASYALGSYVGTNGTGAGTGFNLDNWTQNYGPLPTDQRHELNVAGFLNLPRRFQIALNISAYSAPPFSAYVGGADFNGDGTANDLLPGTTVGEFGRGLSKADLARLVQAYNLQIAGLPLVTGKAPPLTLPAAYEFNDSVFTVDARVTRVFRVNARWTLALFAELFNLFNTANLVNYGMDLTNSSGFGQPGNRSTQVFGSGGPRAAQFGARITL
jgi:hypothetical protein